MHEEKYHSPPSPFTGIKIPQNSRHLAPKVFWKEEGMHSTKYIYQYAENLSEGWVSSVALVNSKCAGVNKGRMGTRRLIFVSSMDM